jgi:lysophospholipase
MGQRVEPMLQQAVTTGKVERIAGEQLYYELYTPQHCKGWVAISHGFCESIPRYHELIYYLLGEGYGAAILEHQGHGRSVRKVEAVWLTHVDAFDDYTEDFTAFLRQIVLPAAGELPVYLLGHSMGGAIAARTLEMTPTLPVQKLVLCSPMISPKTGGLPAWLTLAITHTFIALGKERSCLFNQKAYTGEDNFGSPWCCTNSRPRYAWFAQLERSQPQLQNCSATYRWLQESVLIKQALLRDAEKITVPTLLCQAGQDTMVWAKPQDDFIAKVPKGRKEVFPEARHEIYRCQDATVARFCQVVFDFLAE